ncbi:MAG: hypothetical protein ABI382_02650 [Nakamurella sp.]
MTTFAAILALAAAAVGIGASTAHAETSGAYSSSLAFQLADINPAVVTSDGSGSVTLVGRYTNTGQNPIDNIEFRFQRGPALTTPAAVQAEVKKPSQPSQVVTGFRPLPGTLNAGASTSFAITVPVFDRTLGTTPHSSNVAPAHPDSNPVGSAVDGNPIDSLEVAKPGVYAVMMNVNATVHAGNDSARARVGELHFLVTVASVPAAAPGTGADSGTGPPGGSTPVNILWPLASTPHLGIDGVFANDELARDLTSGGRLATALDALASADDDPDLVTIVVDPMLLDELQRMADGYRVLAAPDTVQGQLRADGVISGTVPGTGQAAAAQYLDTLRSLAAIHRVLLLPYGDADLSALTRAGMTTEAAYAVTRGRDAATRVLVRGPQASDIYSNLVTNIAAPPGGVMLGETAQILAGLGDHAAILAPGGVNFANGKPVTAGLVTVKETATTYDAFQAIVTGGARATQFAQILAGAVPQDGVRALNLLAAELVTTPVNVRTPIVVVPPRQFVANGQGLAALTRLVDDLAESHTLAPTSITTLLGTGHTPGPPATLAYSMADRRAELPTQYLQRINALHQGIDALDQSLSTDKTNVGGADPQDILQPLTDALLPAASTTWRGNLDPAAKQLETVDSTLVWLYGGVQISRDTGSYTLASSTAPLLLTVKNTLPYQVSVSVSIVGGAQAGLDAKGPGLLKIGAGPRSVPVKLDTTVSRSGTFSVFAQLYAAGGTQWAGPVPLTIDSRAYGALTVILMSTAGGVLLLMVIWRLVQRARGRIDDPADALVEQRGAATPDLDSAS